MSQNRNECVTDLSSTALRHAAIWIDELNAALERPLGILINIVLKFTGKLTPLKRLRHRAPDPHQLALQLDFFSPVYSTQPPIDQPTPITSLRQAHAVQPPDNVVPQYAQIDLQGDASNASSTIPDVAPHLHNQRRLILGQQHLNYRLLRSKRRTIGFMIDDDGLRITAPKWVGIGEIENAIREKQRWIFSKLHAHHERAARRLQPQMQWRDGGLIPYLGENLQLKVATAASDGIVHDAALRTLTVCLPANAVEQQLKDRVLAWLQREAKLLFAARLLIYAERLDVQYRAFALSSATTQWGSCTADGKIRLNWRLMHFALPLIDYVIAHELAHLREMNHGPRFWATVQSVFPEFEAAKKALRKHAPETLPVF